MNSENTRTSTPNRKPSRSDRDGPEYERVITNDNFSVCSDVSRASRRRRKNEEKSKNVSIKAPKGQDRHDDGLVKVDLDDDSRHWPRETETFATSECTRISNEDLGKFHADLEAHLNLGKYCDPARFSVIFTQSLAYLTPIIFLILPKICFQPSNDADNDKCDIGCEGGIISIAVRLGILLIGSLVLFWKNNRVKLPQVHLYRASVNALTFSITAVYWIFYSYKVLHWDNYSYPPIVEYSSQYVNILIFLHYLAILLLYLKSKQDIFLLEVVRTTDGFHKFYNIGDISIQEAAAQILEQYYLDFPLYNPALQKTSKTRVKAMANFKNYDIDGPNNDGASVAEKNRAILAAAARRRDAGHNERYYDEVEHERRIRKRLARLTEAAEDSFSHLKRQLKCDSNLPGAQPPLDPIETAHAIFPAMARSMQKYLRTTRQHQHYQMDDIIDHLAFCIRHDMSSNAFLQRYVKKRPSSSYPGKLIESVDWSVNCDEPLITHLRPGVVFSLNQLDYSLVVTCRTAPKIELREEFIDPSSHRFVIRIDGSETSV